MNGKIAVMKEVGFTHLDARLASSERAFGNTELASGRLAKEDAAPAAGKGGERGSG